MHAGLAFQARPHSNGRRGARLTAAAALAVLGGLFGQPAAAQLPQGQPLPAVTELVSSSSAELAGNEDSSDPSVDAAAFLIAFESRASNLVPNDTNDPTPGQIGGGKDVFVRDQQAGTTTRVSVRSNGAQATGRDSSSPAISADGRWVAFASGATNLVNNDVNDRVSGATRLASRSTTGEQASTGSLSPAISADGRWVAFTSRAANLVPSDTNNDFDVFRYDRVTQSTGRFSLTTSGGQTAPGGSSDSPTISADGSKIAFDSDATNMGPANGLITHDVFLRRPDPEVAA